MERERYGRGGHVLWLGGNCMEEEKPAIMVNPFFPKLKFTMIRNEIVLIELEKEPGNT